MMNETSSSGDPADSSSVPPSTHIWNSAIGTVQTGVIFDHISFLINRYVFPFLVACGFFNNILVLIVMSRNRYKKIVSCFYLRSLAVFDIVNMVWFGQGNVSSVMSAGAAAIGDIFCIEVFILSYFATNASNWTTVLMTYTRFVAVVFPLKVTAWCTLKAAHIYMTVFVLFFAAVSSVQCILWVRSSGGNPTYYCYMTLSAEHANIYARVHSVMSQIIPFLLILIFNCGIFLKLRIHTKEDIEIKDRSSKEERAAMTLVMVASVVFLLCVFPYVVVICILDYGYLDANLKTAYQRKFTIFSLNVATTLYCSNSIVNFYLYCICCKKFRDDLVSMFSWFRKQ
jgi:hypothetical protein